MKLLNLKPLSRDLQRIRER